MIRLVASLLCLFAAASPLRSAAAFTPPQSSAVPKLFQTTGRSHRQTHRRLSAAADGSSGPEEIADIEEITTFASNNGVSLLFTSTLNGRGGYRGVAVSKGDPDNVLGYIEGFIRPSGNILHADKMEIFKSALNSARREEESFSGGGTFLGPGLLIAFVCLLNGLENGCEMCEFLAIDDADFQHKRLKRYYRTAGFQEVRYVGEELKDIPDRLVWGGCGTLMEGSIDSILKKWTRIIRGAASEKS